MYHYQLPWLKKKLQMAGYDTEKKEVIYHSSMFPGSQNLSHQRWIMRGWNRSFQLFCQSMTWSTFIRQVNLDLFLSVFQTKLTSWGQKSAMGWSWVKYVLLAWQQQILWVISYPCSSLGRLRIHDASKMSRFYLAAPGTRKKLEGWEIIWRVAQRAGQEVCFWRKKCCLRDSQLPRPSSYWQPKNNQIVFPIT